MNDSETIIDVNPEMPPVDLSGFQPELTSQEPDFNLSLHIWPDPTLKAPVMEFPEENLGATVVRKTAAKMLDMMYHYKGVGLAAQQVGVPFRIFVMDAQKDGQKTPKIFLNPKVTEIDDSEYIQVNHPGEGCLSFPYGVRYPVPRIHRLELEWQDFGGNVFHQWFEGAEAIIVQHELDHLSGYCFYDRLSWLKRNLAFRKARRIRNQYKKGMKRTVSAMKNAKRTPEFNHKRARMFEEGFRAGEAAAKETTND